MADITISSVNFAGFNADFTFYPFTGGTISLGNHTIPYTRTSDNYEGVYDMDITWTDGIPVNCSVQIGASDCVNIETSGATYDYGGIYTYIGQGYLSYDSGTGQWAVICNDTDPKSAALYYLEGSNGQFLGNVFDVVARTTEPRITTFLLLIGLGCGSSTPFTPPSGVVSEIPIYVNGLPAEGTYANGGDSGGTYVLANNPSCAPLDTDAAAYIADVELSGGTIDATITSAVDTLFTSLKSAGLYSKMFVMYPFVGGTAASHAINAKLNKSFDFTFNGGMTHGISGSTGNGINAYGDTNWSWFNWAQDDFSAGYYQVSANTPAKTEEIILGKYNGTAFRLSNCSNLNSTNYFLRGGPAGGGLNIPNGGNIKGNYIITRTGSTQTDLYRNTSLLGSHSGSYTKPALPDSGPNLYFWNMNFDSPAGVPYGNGFANQTLAFAWTAEGLSSAEVSTLDGIINTFQTSLGRNTY